MVWKKKIEGRKEGETKDGERFGKKTHGAIR